jgi:hypothetical protein
LMQTGKQMFDTLLGMLSWSCLNKDLENEN